MDRKYLISSVPDGVDINTVIQRVLVPSIMLLQRGEVSSFFAVTKQVEKFCGTIFNMLGDHMGQIELCGLKGPTCQRPSRYFLTPLNEMEQVRSVALKTWRSDGNINDTCNQYLQLNSYCPVEFHRVCLLR